MVRLRLSLLMGMVLLLGGFDTLADTQTNIALNKPSASSTNQSTSLTHDLAFDGLEKTRWSTAFSDNQWISVDLEGTYLIHRIRLLWQNSHAVEYNIETSHDNENWNVIHEERAGDGGEDIIELNHSARYVRMYGIKRFTKYGFSLFEFEVYGTPTTYSSSSVSSSSVQSNESSSSSLPSHSFGPDYKHTFIWKAPTERENGEWLTKSEIGGYEIHGYNSNNEVIWKKIIESNTIVRFSTQDVNALQSISFKIAVYDTNGLYSEFVTITPLDIAPPTGGRLIF